MRGLPLLSDFRKAIPNKTKLYQKKQKKLKNGPRDKTLYLKGLFIIFSAWQQNTINRVPLN